MRFRTKYPKKGYKWSRSCKAGYEGWSVPAVALNNTWRTYFLSCYWFIIVLWVCEDICIGQANFMLSKKPHTYTLARTRIKQSRQGSAKFCVVKPECRVHVSHQISLCAWTRKKSYKETSWTTILSITRGFMNDEITKISLLPKPIRGFFFPVLPPTTCTTWNESGLRIGQLRIHSKFTTWFRVTTNGFAAVKLF